MNNKTKSKSQNIIELLRNNYGNPSQNHSFKPFYWCLDGGGKELIKDTIVSKNISVMLEVGVFFGGSTKQWLDASSELMVIGIDPFPKLVNYLKNNIHIYEKHIEFKELNYKSLIEQLGKPEGSYFSVMSNLQEYGDRFFPIKGTSPDKLYELKNIGITPELIYIDSDKKMDELEVCHQLFPDCIISGDDWTWHKEEGYPIRKPIEEFAQKYDYEVISSRATWLLKKN